MTETKKDVKFIITIKNERKSVSHLVYKFNNSWKIAPVGSKKEYVFFGLSKSPSKNHIEMDAYPEGIINQLEMRKVLNDFEKFSVIVMDKNIFQMPSLRSIGCVDKIISQEESKF